MYLEDWVKPRRTSIMIADAPAKIRIQHLLNTSQNGMDIPICSVYTSATPDVCAETSGKFYRNKPRMLLGSHERPSCFPSILCVHSG
jgi:hypothetical protein